jgi:hypothetical protein
MWWSGAAWVLTTPVPSRMMPAKPVQKQHCRLVCLPCSGRARLAVLEPRRVVEVRVVALRPWLLRPPRRHRYPLPRPGVPEQGRLW